MNQKTNIAIIGTGLIGGSLAAALKNHTEYNIFCYNRRVEVSQKALELGIIDNFFDSISELVKNSDIIILATPLTTYERLTAEIAKDFTTDKIISDVGSVKFLPTQHILENLDNKFHECVVPAHPIAGSEKTGVEAADKNLFQNKKLIITKENCSSNNNINNKVKLVEKLWQSAGANIYNLQPQEHDAIYAKVSHLPQLLSFFYKKTIEQNSISEIENQLNNPQYKEFTRLCSSSAELWKDIFHFNAEQINKCLEQYSAELKNIFENNTQANIPYIIAQALANIITPKELEFSGTGLKSFLMPLVQNFKFPNLQKSVIDNFIAEFLKEVEAYGKK